MEEGIWARMVLDKDLPASDPMAYLRALARDSGKIVLINYVK